ncbi:hypothetical protein F5Y03DRAFT_390619 [Xylaria venustula]|nr:hypothetical protein F5Y03DRAFT_390619 [Xylaria venustula]
MWPRGLLLFSISTLSVCKAIQYEAQLAWLESAPDSFDDEAEQRLINADHNPTLSRSVSFQPFKDIWGDLDADSALQDSDWTWRVNVSDVAVPDATHLEKNITDPHIVSLTWDFSWPGNDNLSDILGGNGSEFCWVQLDSNYDFPVNVTNTFTEDIATNSSCVPALGKACVDAILKIVPNNCVWESVDIDFTRFPECAGAFADSVHHNTEGEAYIGNFLNNTDPTFQLSSGGPFYLRLSVPVNGAQSETFNAVANGLNIVLLSAKIRESRSEAQHGYVQGSELLCTRVNATKLADKDQDGDGTAYVSEVVLLSSAQSLFSSIYFWRTAALIAGIMSALM